MKLSRLPRRLLFLTPEEQDFVYKRFCLPKDVGEIAGIGLETSHSRPDSTDIPTMFGSV